MFYMERGMWDSNMAVAFNFPDSNELQVEKEVNVDKVNDAFKDLFKDQKLFTFTLQNLATHYGAKPIADNGTPNPWKSAALSPLAAVILTVQPWKRTIIRPTKAEHTLVKP